MKRRDHIGRGGTLLIGRFGQYLSRCTAGVKRIAAKLIDDEVKQLLDEAYADARAILVKHQDELERAAQELLIRETLDADAFYAMLGREAAGQTNEK